MEELDCLEAGSTALDDLDVEAADSDVSLPNSYSSASWAPIVFIDLVDALVVLSVRDIDMYLCDIGYRHFLFFRAPKIWMARAGRAGGI